MVNCPYLTYEPSHCTACTGWFCNVFGRRKKLTDTSICTDNEEWLECTRYKTPIGTVTEPEPELEVEEEVIELPPTEEATTFTAFIGGDVETIEVVFEPETVEAAQPPPRPSNDCPYLGPVPADKVACCGFWCYADDSPIRTTTACTSPPTWRECRPRVKASRREVN